MVLKLANFFSILDIAYTYKDRYAYLLVDTVTTKNGTLAHV